MQIVSITDNMSPFETVCMNCQNLFSKYCLLIFLPGVLNVMHQSSETPQEHVWGGFSAVIKPLISPGSAVDVPGY